MPVAVSLSQLVAISGGYPQLVPSEFVALMNKLECDPTDATQWLVVADWLGEHEEHALADIYRWIARHSEVTVSRLNEYEVWKFWGLDKCLLTGKEPAGNQMTLAGAVAVLAERIRRVREVVA
jgi:uncharacterized protein (TIGR02996 family)